MSEPILIDFIELRARGITDVEKALKDLVDQTTKAEEANKELAKSLADPRVAQQAREYLQLTRQQEATRRIEAERLGLLRQKQTLEQRVEAVESGRYTKSLRNQMVLQRWEMRSRAAERQAAMDPNIVRQRRDLADAQRLESRQAQFQLQRETLLARQRDTQTSRYSDRLDQEVDLARLKNQVRRSEQDIENNNPKFQQFKKEQADLLRFEQERTAEIRRRGEIQSRTEDVQSGRYGQRLKTSRELEQMERKAQQMERRAELGFRYGRLGNVAYQVERLNQSPLGSLLRGGMGGAALLGGGMFGMATAGLSGTVEGNRIMSETTMIMREFANAAKPVFDLTITGLTSFRKVLQSLNPETQRLLTGFIATGAALAFMRFTGVGSLITSGIGLAAQGIGGLMGGRAAAGAVAAAGGASAIGASTALSGMASSVSTPAGGLANAVKSPAAKLPSMRTGPKWWQGRGFGAPLLIPDEGEAEIVDRYLYENYGLRGITKPSDRPNQANTDGMKQLNELVTDRKRFARQQLGLPTEDPKQKQKVTIADAGFAELGAGYERLANAFALIGASEETSQQDGLIGEMQNFIKQLEQLAVKYLGGGNASEAGEVVKLNRGRN